MTFTGAWCCPGQYNHNPVFIFTGCRFVPCSWLFPGGGRIFSLLSCALPCVGEGETVTHDKSHNQCNRHRRDELPAQKLWR